MLTLSFYLHLVLLKSVQFCLVLNQINIISVLSAFYIDMFMSNLHMRFFMSHAIYVQFTYVCFCVFQVSYVTEPFNSIVIGIPNITQVCQSLCLEIW